MRTSTKITTRRTKRAILLASIAWTLVVPASGALAGPPHGGDGAHIHHVHRGDGGCTVIDSVEFNPESRGLHRGANSSGHGNGVWHGPCHEGDASAH